MANPDGEKLGRISQNIHRNAENVMQANQMANHLPVQDYFRSCIFAGRVSADMRNSIANSLLSKLNDAWKNMKRRDKSRYSENKDNMINDTKWKEADDWTRFSVSVSKYC